MGFEVDPKLVNKLKSQMREKILANPEIPDEIKFSGTLDFDIPAKVELSDKQMAVAVKLLKGYYNNKPVDLQKDLNSIDRKLAWTILQGGDFSGMDFHGVDFSVSNLLFYIWLLLPVRCRYRWFAALLFSGLKPWPW